MANSRPKKHLTIHFFSYGDVTLNPDGRVPILERGAAAVVKHDGGYRYEWRLDLDASSRTAAVAMVG